MSTSASRRRPGRLAAAASAALALILVPAGVFAQQRPLQTQDPEPIGAGEILVQAGVDHGRDVTFPASGLTGNLTRGPLIGLLFGVGSIVEIDLTGGPYQRLAITDRQPAPLSDQLSVTGDSTHSVVDMAIGAKVRVLPETATRPAVAFLFSTSLPNAKHPSGLGLNTIDFFTGFAVGKTMAGFRVAGNLGLGILPNPVNGQSQNDVLTYGLSLTRRVSRQVELLGEVAGRASTRRGEPPPGTGSRGTVYAGARYRRGSMLLDGGLMFGMKPMDPTVGFSAGVAWMFHAWTM